jgi:hypothetical protein
MSSYPFPNFVKFDFAFCGAHNEIIFFYLVGMNVKVTLEQSQSHHDIGGSLVAIDKGMIRN